MIRPGLCNPLYNRAVAGISDVLDLSSLTTLFQTLTALLGAFLAALWVSLVFWTYRDIRARTEDKLIHVLASLITAVMGPLGLLIYLVLRPVHTIDETYQHTLEEEALLAEIEEQPLCPGCGSHTHDDWQVCPHCHTHLRKSCHNCARLMQLSWQICPYCGTPAPGVRAEKASESIESSLS
jgi:RNA polymerase subunit RPABC4/transcription elongation factor Spt4